MSLLHAVRIQNYRSRVVSRLSFPLFTAGLLHREGKMLAHTETEPDSTDRAETSGGSGTSQSGLFDITKQWEEATKEKSDFLRKLIETNGDQEPTTDIDNQTTEKQIRGTGTDGVFSHFSQAVSDAMRDTSSKKADATASTENFKDMSKTLLNLLITGGGSSTVEGKKHG
jgi:hypothetical protein